MPARSSVQTPLINFLSKNVGRLVTLQQIVDGTGLTERQVKYGLWRTITLVQWPVAVVIPGRTWQIYADFASMPGGTAARTGAPVPLPVPAADAFAAALAGTPPTNKGRMYETVTDLGNGKELLKREDGAMFVADLRAV